MKQSSKTTIKPLQNIDPKAIDLIARYITYFVAYSAENKIPCTTKTLVDHFPRLIVEAHGLLSDIYINECHINSYREIGEVLDYLVKNKQFFYSDEDNIEDFNKKSCLVVDIRNAMKEHSKHLEERLNKKNENTSNPYQ